MSESNVERLQRIKQEWLSIQIHFTRLSGKELKLFQMSDDFEFLVQQAERFEILSEQHDVALAENKRLREALKFYADDKNYEPNVVDQWAPVVPVNKDYGEIARAVLEEDE